eukprot:NODE_19394_length_845_cov_2.927577.p1 GENE.NODE_19394_length_845_cov_2.927577~~NODE_19394_length_845_cov_2.927577.p1  ORF type:complete len:176 (+),score=15.75 NODE_19394_length_845_cov_2.927577:81-608(+)
MTRCSLELSHRVCCRSAAPSTLTTRLSVCAPCRSRHSLFFFSDVSGGDDFVVRLGHEDLMERQGDGEWCRFGIMRGPASMPFVLLGDPFLRRVYIVLEYASHRVRMFHTGGWPHTSQPTSGGILQDILQNIMILGALVTIITLVHQLYKRHCLGGVSGGDHSEALIPPTAHEPEA